MPYINSDKIIVFPSTRRGANQQDARLLTEKSMAGIINQLIDLDGFIITPPEKISSTNSFEFNIKGYYFKVNQLKDITDLFNTSTALKIFGVITLDEGNGYIELMGQDDTQGNTQTSIYKGVSFSDTSSAAANTYSLQLLYRTSSSSTTWLVPENSRFKFISSSLNIDIDGGII